MTRVSFRKTTLFLPFLLTAFLAASCGKKQADVKLTTAAPETTKAAETKAPETKAEVTSAPESEKKIPNASMKVTIRKYEVNNVSVEYPVVQGMDDAAQEDKLNLHLKENALSIIYHYPDSNEAVNTEEDTLDVDCNIISSDSNRITVTYTGYYSMKNSAHPSNLFYANTVDIRSLKDIGLSNIADPGTMAAYAVSDDVVLADHDGEYVEEKVNAYLDWIGDSTKEQYTECLNKADFPLRTGKSQAWPDSFSYEAGGMLYFSVPVPHALGDYVIIQYDVTTK